MAGRAGSSLSPGLLRNFVFLGLMALSIASLLYSGRLAARLEKESALFTDLFARFAASATLPASQDEEVQRIFRGFMDKLEAEVQAKGIYTQTGFADKTVDIGEPGLAIKGLGVFKYDPTLDDLGYVNFCFALDQRNLYLQVMEGEDMKQHAPARPAEKYVMYRAVTWTGCMISRKMNCHGVFEAA